MLDLAGAAAGERRGAAITLSGATDERDRTLSSRTRNEPVTELRRMR